MNSQINELLDKGMLLVARGVQDESQIEEPLAQCYPNKQMLKKNCKSLMTKYNALKQGQTGKTIKNVEKNSNEHTVYDTKKILQFLLIGLL